MGDGLDIAVVLSAAVGGGLVVFAKTLLEELAKDAYAAARDAVRRTARRLRQRAHEGEFVRANYVLMIEIGTLRFVFGTELHQQPSSPDEWADDWLVRRLGAAGAVVRSAPTVLVEHSLREVLARWDFPEEKSYEAHQSAFYWNDVEGGWVPDDGMSALLDWGRAYAQLLDERVQALLRIIERGEGRLSARQVDIRISQLLPPGELAVFRELKELARLGLVAEAIERTATGSVDRWSLTETGRAALDTDGPDSG